MHTLRKLAWLEVKLLVRERLTPIFTFAFPLSVLLVMGQVFGNEPDPAQPEVFRNVGPMDHYLPGYIGLSVAAIGLIALPVHLSSYRERGVLKRFRASGISAGMVISAQALVAGARRGARRGCWGRGARRGGFLVHDVHAPESPGGVVLGFVASLACFASIGVLLGAVMPSARAPQGIGLMPFFAMMFLSGTDGPREILGDVLRNVGEAFPLTHTFILMQDPWIGFGTTSVVSRSSSRITVAAAILAARAFRWE